jgi:Ca2+:H+ antiporter
MNWLLIFVPIAIGLEFLAPERYLLVFLASALAILPLAGWMGRATEQLAARMGEGVGGFSTPPSATPPNSSSRSRRSAPAFTTSSRPPSPAQSWGTSFSCLAPPCSPADCAVPSNISMRPGRVPQATMLVLAAIGLVSPAAFQAATGATPLALGKLSVAISVVLLLVYLLYLVFVLVTHSALFSGPYHEEESETKGSVGRAALVLAAATAAIAWISEIMVGAIEPTAHEFGLSNVFVGVFIVAILGNAAEHATAIAAAMKDRMDLSLSIAIGSSVQVALFVAPILVFASLFLGPSPMDLAFPAGLVLMVLLSAIVTAQVAGDGRSDWLKGVQLLAVYLIFGPAFFFLPSA